MCNLDLFDWVSTPKSRLPSISRIVNGERIQYVSVRHAEIFLLAKYLSFIHHDIVSTCTFVKALNISKEEASLLSLINYRYMNNAQCLFTFVVGKDYIASLEDTMNFYYFIKLCYRCLRNRVEPDDIYQFGYVKLHLLTCFKVVPYVLINNIKYLPLFYFNDVTTQIRRHAVPIKGLNMSFIKFCCKVQGIEYNIIEVDQCKGLSLDAVKRRSPKVVSVDEHFWPKKIHPALNIFNNNSKVVANSWIKIPMENLDGKHSNVIIIDSDDNE